MNMIGFLSGVLLGAASSSNNATHYAVRFIPWQESIPIVCFAVFGCIFMIYLIMSLSQYLLLKEELSDGISGDIFIPFYLKIKMQVKDIQKTKIKNRIEYLSKRYILLSPSYVAQKILRKKINAKIQTLNNELQELI